MNADEWLNECLSMGERRKDALGISIPRELFLKDVFADIQKTVVFEVPVPNEGEDLKMYHRRVCVAAKKSGGTVVTKVK
ncbi:hypothetical protein [Symbiopectobacterium purcellii]|uniref:Uncharacterized protein n=1 Tax=Symbiopectobacterium purcellii TaxID=2871826 RepID=A0ABX9AGD5_9ENTR|nr:hypothetical protein [Symbiopectobacterium purcellii]QZN94152.1 hypothetical protein K6K13_12205 [Symbiopectobacterium purcellii]